MDIDDLPIFVAGSAMQAGIANYVFTWVVNVHCAYVQLNVTTVILRSKTA